MRAVVRGLELEHRARVSRVRVVHQRVVAHHACEAREGGAETRRWSRGNPSQISCLEERPASALPLTSRRTEGSAFHGGLRDIEYAGQGAGRRAIRKPARGGCRFEERTGCQLSRVRTGDYHVVVVVATSSSLGGAYLTIDSDLLNVRLRPHRRSFILAAVQQLHHLYVHHGECARRTLATDPHTRLMKTRRFGICHSGFPQARGCGSYVATVF